eukprot:superscaffoldBa00000164_g2337
MYSGLLPKGLTEDDLSPDDEEQREGEKCESSAEKWSSVGGNTGSMVEEQSSHTVSDADYESATSSLPGISQEMWQKFHNLRKKKDEVMKTMKVPRRRKRRHKKGVTGTDSEEPAETSQHQEEQEKPWDGLKQYFGVNDRFHPPACSKPPPKLAVKIAQAADCRDFVQRKQEEEALRAAQKRKRQIAWGFEAKKRWETKSNMGFM